MALRARGDGGEAARDGFGGHGSIPRSMDGPDELLMDDATGGSTRGAGNMVGAGLLVQWRGCGARHCTRSATSR